MRFSNSVITLIATGFLTSASAKPHGHKLKHNHLEKGDQLLRVLNLMARSPASHVKIVTVPGPTLLAFELNGKAISQTEACKGIKDGTLKFADSTYQSQLCLEHGVSPTSPMSGSSIPKQFQKADENRQNFDQPSEIKSFTTSPSKKAAVISFAAANRESTLNSSNGSVGLDHSDGQGLDTEFVDGKIDCSHFPSDYGPIAIPWINLGGWSGIQYPTVRNQRIIDIKTGVNGGQNCSAGALCSYACPPGYQKSQWPAVQGVSGQSVGGLQCNSDNKLQLTNPELSKTLCIRGTGATKVQNKLSNNAAICRTDYPGTEDETVPLNTQPGTTSELTCPSSSTYFKHRGSPTSAQYYVNNKGVPLEEACRWNVDGSSKGNWAPTYFGVGQDLSGKTWLSIASTKQNNPTKFVPLDYTAEITGEGLSGRCRVKEGKYCSGDQYGECNDSGCTVELLHGEAVYVLSD
ncbi:MAG: hypothetical protein LQ342_002034 [Letrouitia transgressa]|nr:MAG: hypothetical protein LQ342_002034 [Letrouitia transgressa]